MTIPQHRKHPKSVIVSKFYRQPHHSISCNFKSRNCWGFIYSPLQKVLHTAYKSTLLLLEILRYSVNTLRSKISKDKKNHTFSDFLFIIWSTSTFMIKIYTVANKSCCSCNCSRSDNVLSEKRCHRWRWLNCWHLGISPR